MDAHAWNDADALTRSGVELIRQRKFADALDELEQAAAIDPLNPVILFHMGVAYDELDRLEEAVEVYQRAIEVGGDETETLNRLAIDLHQTGHSRESVETFERIERLDPTYEAAYCNRIHVLVEMNEHEQAEEVFYLGRLQREHCPQCYFNIGVSLAARGLYRKAISCFGRAMELPDSAGHVHRRMADCLLADGRLDGARQHYIKALAHDGSDVAALISLADVLMQLCRYNEAEQRLNAGLRFAPDHPQVQLLWGRLMYERGDDGASGMALRRAIQLDPTVLKAHLTLARIAVRHAQFDTAVHHLRAELMLGPHTPVTLSEIGHLLLDISEWHQASACYRRLLEMDPAISTAWQNLGIAEAKSGRIEPAIIAFNRAIDLNPHAAGAWHNLALAQAELDHWRDAFETIKQGLIQLPRDPVLISLRLRLRLRRIRNAVVRPFAK